MTPPLIPPTAEEVAAAERLATALVEQNGQAMRELVMLETRRRAEEWLAANHPGERDSVRSIYSEKVRLAAQAAYPSAVVEAGRAFTGPLSYLSVVEAEKARAFLATFAGYTVVSTLLGHDEATQATLKKVVADRVLPRCPDMLAEARLAAEAMERANRRTRR